MPARKSSLKNRNASVITDTIDMIKLFFILASFPLLYWPYGIETASQLKQAGIEQIAVAPEKVDEWRKTELKIVSLNKLEIDGRERLVVPQIQRNVNVASPTRAPWVDANGWRFLRKPGGQFFYDLPAKRASLALAECFAYNADAVMKIEADDLEEYGKMLAFLHQLPAEELPPMADFLLIDDRTATTAEVMNLLIRRNLLFRLTDAPSTLYRLNVKIGTKEFPLDEASDPSSFAAKIRRLIGDENRALRIYGSEVVIGRLFNDGKKMRVHLLNYGGREIEGLRVRLKGKFGKANIQTAGIGAQSMEDYLVAEGATEFTIPKMKNYALIELPVNQ